VVRSKKTEVRGQKSEFGGQRSKLRIAKLEIVGPVTAPAIRERLNEEFQGGYSDPPYGLNESGEADGGQAT
jgi:hypothetical protein